MEKWKTAWLRSECVSLVRNDSEIKRLMTEVDIEMKDLDVTDQKMLFRVSLCPDDVPMIKADLKRKCASGCKRCRRHFFHMCLIMS